MRPHGIAVLALLGLGCPAGGIAQGEPGGPDGSGLSTATLRAADRTLPRPRRLPTIAAIDWDAFPNDRTGAFGRSGRVIEVRPGKPGVIAAAVARARRGDTIVAHGGTYREGRGDDHRAIVIQTDGLVLRSAPGTRARIIPRPGVNRGIELQASNVMIQGLDLVGFKDAGIGLGREDHTVSNLIISDVRVVFSRGGWHDGIVVYPDLRSLGKPAVNGLLLRNVRVENASLGISCNSGPCRSFWLENVTVRNAASGGGSGADAISMEEGENVVIVNAEATGATADGIDLKARNVLVLGSHVHHVARNGIKLWRGGDIVNTLVHHTGADSALVFKDPGRYRVLHSVMAFHNYRRGPSYNLTAGYDTKGRLEVELANSIFYNTSGGMFFSDNTRLRISSCIFFGMENRNILRALVRGREIEYQTGPATARAIEKAGLGTGLLLVDPRFVAPERGDFRLRAGSPALNRGARVAPAPVTDRNGAPRVLGAAPDLGPFELE